MLRGGVPYRDAWDFKGPLTFFVFAALQAMFGTQMWAIRLLDLLLLAASAYAAARIVLLFAGRVAAACTGLMLVITFASFGSWYTGQPDGWAANLLVVTASLLLTRSPVPAGRLAWAGAIIGATALIKPLYATYLVLVLCTVWPEDRGELASSLRRFAIAFAAFLASVAIGVAWFAARGALADLIDVHLRFNFERISTDPYLQMSMSHIARSTLGILTSLPHFACVLAPALFGAVVLFRERKRTCVFFLLWLATALFSVGAQRKFMVQNYSWHPICAPLVLLAGIGLARLWHLGAVSREARSLRWLVGAMVAVLFKLTAHEPMQQFSRWWSYASGQLTLAQYRASFDVDVPSLKGAPASTVGFSVARDIELADYFSKNTRPDDKVLVWGDPLANYLSSRPAITPITLSTAFTVFGTQERRHRYRSHLLASLSDDSAVYFGALAKDLSPGTDETNIPTHFPELVALLEASYERVGAIGDVELFKHKTP
jgi:hypothetical protein